jgi:hypothetical protein
VMNRDNVSHLLTCMVCGASFQSIKASAHCCRRPFCQMAVMDVTGIMVLQAILGISHWSGGPGWPTWEASMEEAVKRLPQTERQLWEMLVLLLEESERRSVRESASVERHVLERANYTKKFHNTSSEPPEQSLPA